MWRVILVTFVALAFVFYEMSGGADFVPETRASLAPVKHEAVARGNTSHVDLVSVAGSAPDTDARRNLVRDSVEHAATGNQPEFDPTAFFKVVKVSEPVGAETSVPVVEAAQAPKPDIRAVSGTRVNMRSGPGTQFSVVTKLSKGAEVEVLQNPGNGWLKLRVLDSQRVGWMSASLVAQPEP